MTPAEILETLVSIPSPSKNEGAIADWITLLLQERGIHVRRKGNNLWFQIGDEGLGGPRLLVNSHLDTVPPCAGWDTDPYQPVWKDDRL